MQTTLNVKSLCVGQLANRGSWDMRENDRYWLTMRYPYGCWTCVCSCLHLWGLKGTKQSWMKWQQIYLKVCPPPSVTKAETCAYGSLHATQKHPRSKLGQHRRTGPYATSRWVKLCSENRSRERNRTYGSFASRSTGRRLSWLVNTGTTVMTTV